MISFSAFIALFGGQGFDPEFILVHLAAGGVMMGAIFMATDPVTSPVTSAGQLVFGILIGILCGVFRVFGSAPDSASYAIIIANMTASLRAKKRHQGEEGNTQAGSDTLRHYPDSGNVLKQCL